MAIHPQKFATHARIRGHVPHTVPCGSRELAAIESPYLGGLLGKWVGATMELDTMGQGHEHRNMKGLKNTVLFEK